MLKVKRFLVQRLHDVFTYDLSFDELRTSEVAILYGDNGSGKTTILKLLFHILSSSSNRGHLTAISKTPFHTAKVTLSDSSVISVQRKGGALGFPIIFDIERPGKPLIVYAFAPDNFKRQLINDAFEAGFKNSVVAKETRYFRPANSPQRAGPHAELTVRMGEDAHKAYIAALKELDVTVFFLSTDRRILSDEIDPLKYSLDRDTELVTHDQVSTLLTAYLKDALHRGGRHLNRQIIRASNIGSKNINDVYADIFRRILKQGNATPTDEVASTLRSLIAELRLLQRRQRRFVKLGLSPDLDVNSFIPGISSIPAGSRSILEKVLTPFIATLKARLDAMEPIRESVETFLRSLNGFFKFKRIEYSPTSGFTILGPLGDPLEVEQLSSGEQQLLLIFCSVLAANERNSIFIIDEPEISLNVKWQREILASLSRISRSSESQLLISTHSIELLSQYSDSVVILDPIISRNKNPIYEQVSHDD